MTSNFTLYTNMETIDNYVTLLTARNHATAQNDHCKYRYSVSCGKKYARVCHEPILAPAGTQTSVHTFVSLESGDIYFAASWKSPSKRIVGNVNNADPLQGTTDGGGNYAR